MKTLATIAAIGGVALSFGGEPVPPAHHRHFPRTLYLTEIPLVTTYSNGNPWTGWTGRWIDWPIMVDRSIGYVEGVQYRVLWPDFKRTLEEIADGGLDGTTFNVASRNLDQLIAAALERGEKLPALTIPDYPPQKRTDGFRKLKEEEPWFAPAFYNKNGYFFRGKPLVTSYWTGRATKEEEAERLAYMREKHGDFWYVPNVALLSPSQWKSKIRRGVLCEDDFEKAREKLRTMLRRSDGVRYDGYNAVTDVFDGERSFDADFFRKYIARIIREVYAEPEFKDKLLSVAVGMGHDNTYAGTQRDSSNGTKTLRDSITCALVLDPDFLTFFEWDEWNENTGVRPTFWNSFAARRVVRAMKAAAEGRPAEPPLAGDDIGVPNLIVSFRKTLALGDCLRIEVLSVPDAAAHGTAEVALKLRDEDGNLLETFEPARLDLEKMDERRFKWDSARAGDACAVQFDLEVTAGGVRRRYGGLPFAEIRATANWDRKWVLMPLRDVLHGAACEVSPAGSRDGAVRIRVKATAPRVLDRVDVTDGGDLVYSASGDERNDFREDAEHYVFRSMNFCSIYTQQGATMNVEGVKDAEWMLGTKRTRGLSRKLFPQGEFTTDTFVRLRKDEATKAVLRLLWPGNGDYEIPLSKVLASGVYSIAGTNGFCFAVHRFNRQAAFFTPIGARSVESLADIVPDLPVSVFGGHAITPDGKIYRSRPLVLGRSGRKVPVKVWSEMRQRAVDVEVDVARVPDLVYDVSGEKTGTVAASGYGWAFNGILGGSTAAATRRNRGGDSRQHCCTEERRNMPSRAPEVHGAGSMSEMRFDGTGTYFVMPGGTIPTTCAYRFSFEFKPEDPERDQEIFACGTPLLWGVIGFLRMEKGGRLHGVGLGLHEYGDAHFHSAEPAKKNEWNKVEIVSDVDTIELFLNGKGSGRKKLVQPGRCNCNCWFGGRKGCLYKGSIRNVRVEHGNVK